MTALIPLDAAIAAVNRAIWKSPIKSQISAIDASNDTAEALRAIPAIDPAAIREAALREAASVAARLGVYPELNVHNGGPEWYKHGKNIEKAILAMIGEKK